MTLEELKKIPLKMVAHTSMEDAHSFAYKSTDPSVDIGMYVHQPYRNGVPHGQSQTCYRWKCRFYNTVEKLLEDMNKVQNGNKETDK